MAVYFNTIAPATGTTVTVTGIPFEPVAVIFFGVHNPLNNISQHFGVASGASSQWSLWGGIQLDAVTPYPDRHSETRDDCCINVYSLTDHTTLQSRGSLSAFTSDGFSVAFTGAGGTQPIFYMAIGGQNITATHAGTFSAGNATGTTAVTGVGFEPKAVIVGHIGQATGSVNTQGNNMGWGLGVADASLNQFSDWAFALQGASATAGDHMQRTDAIACASVSVVPLTYVLELASMDSDGFTVDCTDATGVGDWVHGYLAIDAAAAVVGSAEFPDSTGVVSYSTPGMEPGGVLFTWNGADTPSSSGSSTMPVRPGVGAMDGFESAPTKDDGGSISGLHRSFAPFGSYLPLQTWTDVDALHIKGADGQTSPDANTVFSAGRFNLFDMGEFQLNWTTATANSREFGWLALPGEIQAPWIPRFYRRGPRG